MSLDPRNMQHYEVHLDLVKAMKQRLESRFTGRKDQIQIGSRPQDTFSMGLLAPEYKAKEAADDESDRAFLERNAPSSMGYDFYIRDDEVDEASLAFDVSGAFYAAIVPKFSEVLDHLESPRQAKTEKEEDGPAKAPPKLRVERFSRRHDMEAQGIFRIRLRDLVNQEAVFTPVAEAEIAGVVRQMSADPQCMRELKYGAGDLRLERPPTDEDDYRELLDKAFKDKLSVLSPALRLELMAVRHPERQDLWMVRARLVNCGTKTEGNMASLHEPYFFDANLRTHVDGAILHPIESEALHQLDYRYDARTWVHGYNTNVHMNQGILQFDHFPMYEQFAYEPRDLPEAARPRFAALRDAPLERLKALRDEMQKYHDDRWNAESFATAQREGQLPASADIEEFYEARAQFAMEIDRFSHGIRMLERHEDVRNAFVWMNEVMLRSVTNPKTGKPRFDAWHIFQIVYIVSIISDIAARIHDDATYRNASLAGGNEEARDIVDVLWFPTGGGKTETYLGVILWNAWWDRLRGKHFGTTAWAKFPLRLLSLQQQGRFLAVLMHANALLQELKSKGLLKQSEPFSLGYFVGGRNTPNRWTAESLVDGQEESILEIAKRDPERRRDWNVVPTCPLCGRATELIPDPVHARLRITCPDHNELPVYIVDMEIYRYTPTVLLGTLDKMAVMAHNARFRRIFVGEEYRCQVHGYCRSGDSGPECEMGTGKCKQATNLHGLEDVGPTLLLQDELHLLEASLGSFESHYESFIDHYQKELLPKVVDRIVPGSRTKGRWKILGATATIKGYDSQVWKLYLRQSNRFPNPGPTRYESFYAHINPNKVRRLMAAFRPNNMPTPTALKEALAEMRVFAAELVSDPARIKEYSDSAAALTTADLRVVVDNLLLSMSYHLSKAESTAIDHWWSSNVNERLKAQVSDLPEQSQADCSTLTGDTPFYEVVEISRKVSEAANTSKPFIAHLAATKMVSHGVDIARLNMMVFDGMPRSHAEYIQSSSRAGRTWPGLVLNVINTKRTRDLSHYEFHSEYHDRLDLHVENVAVTRWGGFTYQKTAPGLVAALIMLYLAPKRFNKPLYKPSHLAEMIAEGGCTQDEITQEVLAGYGCHIDPEGELYKREVPPYVHHILQGVLNKDQASNFFEGFSDTPPMRSMRDIEGTVNIGADPSTLRFLDAKRPTSPSKEASDSDAEDSPPSWEEGEEFT